MKISQSHQKTKQKHTTKKKNYLHLQCDVQTEKKKYRIVYLSRNLMKITRQLDKQQQFMNDLIEIQRDEIYSNDIYYTHLRAEKKHTHTTKLNIN